MSMNVVRLLIRTRERKFRSWTKRFDRGVESWMNRRILGQETQSKIVHFYSSRATKRTTWEQCIYWGPTTDRPTTDQRPTGLSFWKISNGHISATGHPIHFIFGSIVGFSRSADRMALLPVGPNPRLRPPAVLYNFLWAYLWNRWNGSPIQFVFGSRIWEIMRED